MSAVLIVSPEPWDAHPVSKHHYARVLAESGRSVLFLDPPTQSGTAIEVQAVPEVPGLRVLRGLRVAPGLRFMPAALRNWLEARWLARVEALTDTVVSTIWLFENSRFFDPRFAGNRLKIYHQVDLNQDHHPQVAARTADVCLCTTEIIRSRLRAVRQDVHKIHHGVATPATQDGDAEIESAFAGPALHAVCVGNLDMPLLDVSALKRLVDAYPDVRFHFVGGYQPTSPLFLALGRSENAVWWGKQTHGRVQAFLSRGDVLLVAYDATRFRDQLASPHKMMEYLLSGKTIVCSYTDEYKDKPHLVEMAEPDEAIDAIFARVVSDLDTYNAPARMAERRAFALDHTYERQLKRIEDIVRDATGRTI